MADKKRSGKPLWLEITGTLLTPIVIAMASYYYVTTLPIRSMSSSRKTQKGLQRLKYKI